MNDGPYTNAPIAFAGCTIPVVVHLSPHAAFAVAQDHAKGGLLQAEIPGAVIVGWVRIGNNGEIEQSRSLAALSKTFAADPNKAPDKQQAAPETIPPLAWIRSHLETPHNLTGSAHTTSHQSPFNSTLPIYVSITGRPPVANTTIDREVALIAFQQAWDTCARESGLNAKPGVQLRTIERLGCGPDQTKAATGAPHQGTVVIDPGLPITLDPRWSLLSVLAQSMGAVENALQQECDANPTAWRGSAHVRSWGARNADREGPSDGASNPYRTSALAGGALRLGFNIHLHDPAATPTWAIYNIAKHLGGAGIFRALQETLTPTLFAAAPLTLTHPSVFAWRPDGMYWPTGSESHMRTFLSYATALWDGDSAFWQELRDNLDKQFREEAARDAEFVAFNGTTPLCAAKTFEDAYPQTAAMLASAQAMARLKVPPTLSNPTVAHRPSMVHP